MSAEADLSDLVTLRDWLRYGVSLFTQANLSFGHGTDTALDEAAFLILSALHLPIDELEPWLDCRLTRTERTAIRDLLHSRVETRKPAAYLVNAAYIQGRRFYVDERTIVPRSYIGELLCDGAIAALMPPDATVTRVMDLCTGSGCLAILAAEAFPNASVDALDISRDALDVARRNLAGYGLEARITLVQSDLFNAAPTQSYDLFICNPPYVTAATVAAFPPEHRAEPMLAHLGGDDGLDLVRRILREAAGYLTDTGVLIVEVGTGRAALEAEFPHLPFLWLDTEASTGEVFALNANDLEAHRA